MISKVNYAPVTPQTVKAQKPTEKFTKLELDGGGSVEINTTAFKQRGTRIDKDLGEVPVFRFNSEAFNIPSNTTSTFANSTKLPDSFKYEDDGNTTTIAEQTGDETTITTTDDDGHFSMTVEENESTIAEENVKPQKVSTEPSVKTGNVW